MQWERRKSLWPVVAALGLLLVLALAAPRSWQTSSRMNPSVSEAKLDLPIESSANGPATTDWVAAQPLVSQCVEMLREQTLQEETFREETLPVRKEIDFDTLLEVRGKLRTLFGQLSANLPSPAISPAREQPSTQEQIANLPPRQVPQVRVASENDRLAMIPRRASIVREVTTPALIGPSFSGASPRTSSGTLAHEEVADFAAVLLEASRKPKQLETARVLEPRLAMRSAKPKPIEVIVSAKPTVVEIEEVLSPTFAPAPVEAKTIEPAPLQIRPLALIEKLEGFAAGSRGAVWSQLVLGQLRHLTEESSGERPETTETLRQLEQLYIAGARQSAEVTNPTFNITWQQTAQSLGRRLVLWRLLLDPEQQNIVGESASVTTYLLPVLSEVAELLKTEQSGNDWSEYLQLDQLAAATSESISSPALARTKLAQKVLSRMADPQLTDAQRSFLSTPQLVNLHQALRPWAAGKVNLETLAALVERYESGRETRYAVVIAQLQQRLMWSEDAQMRALADHLDQYYRGANMRLAFSDDLLNRMVSKQEPIVTPVQTRIAGVKVRGRARTTTQVRVHLLPDPDTWHFDLQATGKVYSDTRSDTWPARIRNAAKMQYQGHKEFFLGEQGVRVTPARAMAQGRNELIGVDSQLDPIPLVGHLLRNAARKKHKNSRPTALREAKANVVRTVKQRMDKTLNNKLEIFEEKFREKVLAPIEQLALLAEPLDMHTTKDRAVMNLRFANTGQLAAHTLRPLAPSDSVLSLQMHETALNNAMAGLGLDGRRMTMHELFSFITQRFGQPDATPPEDMPRGAVIEFARRDALRVQCDGDRLELVMSIGELAHRRDKIRNFQIHVHYRPVLSGLSVKLVREGSLQFSGRRLKTGPRIVLHSVMGKLFAKDQEINLVNAKLMLDPRFAGLMVTQLVIEDGWVGLALGPARRRRTAWRAPTPEVLETPFVR